MVHHANYRFLVTNLEDRAVLFIIKVGKEVLKLSALDRSSVNHHNVDILSLLGPYECMCHLFCSFLLLANQCNLFSLALPSLLSPQFLLPYRQNCRRLSFRSNVCIILHAS